MDHERLAQFEAALDLPLETGVPLAPLTSFRIGGPARWFVAANTADELAHVVLAAREAGLDYFLLGQGANILVGDRGFPGLVIHNRARRVSLSGTRLTAESGAAMYPDVIDTAVSAGLSGLEHFVGIPSSVGGAVWQNLHFLSPAPARERTMFLAECLAGAALLTEENERREVDNAYFRFGYDYSILHDRRDVVLAATFELQPTDADSLGRVMQENLAWRAERHPPLESEPSAGSIFRKIEGIGAGRLIDEAGLKGLCHGGAQISERHANIIINRDGASAADVCALIMHAQQTVKARTGYWLEPEISFIGDFDKVSRIRVSGRD